IDQTFHRINTGYYRKFTPSKEWNGRRYSEINVLPEKVVLEARNIYMMELIKRAEIFKSGNDGFELGVLSNLNKKMYYINDNRIIKIEDQQEVPDNVRLLSAYE